jgi:hypothetical protein
MENLIQNIIDDNNKKELTKNRHKEILFIADIHDYRERMSKNFIKFIDYLKDNLKNFKIVYYGTGIPGFKKGLSLIDVIKIYCKKSDPIVWICDVRGPTLVSNIYLYDGIKIFDYEDMMGKSEIIIREINENGYEYIFYKADCLETDKIKKSCLYCKFIRYDHYIDDKIFCDYQLKKEYDILCFGCTDYGCYPFRERLFKLLEKEKENGKINIHILKHPGYGYQIKHKMIDENLSKLINKSKLTVVTPSTFDILLKKYVEIALSKSCMIGKLPKYNAEAFRGCIVDLDENMSDEEIMNKILFYLDNNDLIDKFSKKSYEIAKNKYTYKNGLEYMSNIFDNLDRQNNNDDKISQIHVSNDLVFFQNKIKRKFDLVDYYDRYKPAIFFGLYNYKDYHLIRNHKGKCILIWGGTDSLMISEWNIMKLLDYDANILKFNTKMNILIDKFKEFRDKNILLDIIKNINNVNISATYDIPTDIYNILIRPNMKHISISSYIENDLDRINIKSARINLSFVDKNKFNAIEKGNSVYIYTSKNNPNIYGEEIYKKVIEKMPEINFIVVCSNDYENVMDAYKKCFIGLRLTKHDGNANTVQELGLCGIKCIHNSDYPNALQWKTIDDIIETINNEKKYIGTKDINMSLKMLQYIDSNNLSMDNL